MDYIFHPSIKLVDIVRLKNLCITFISELNVCPKVGPILNYLILSDPVDADQFRGFDSL